MQIDFIGHGLNTNNKLNVGDQLATSFGSSHFDSFIGFVAFAAISGVNKFVSSPFLVHFKSRKIVSLFNCLFVPAVGRSGAEA